MVSVHMSMARTPVLRYDVELKRLLRDNEGYGQENSRNDEGADSGIH